MRALNFLVGNWQGKVRYEPGANQHQESSWTAHVHYNLGGNILLIDEIGGDIENRDRITIEILVVVYWDPAVSEYPAQLYWSTQDGAGSVEGKVYVQDNTFVLQTNSPSQINRYTIRLNDKGQWHEIGEISHDGGESWKQTFEMTLNRQG